MEINLDGNDVSEEEVNDLVDRLMAAVSGQKPLAAIGAIGIVLTRVGAVLPPAFAGPLIEDICKSVVKSFGGVHAVSAPNPSEASPEAVDLWEQLVSMKCAICGGIACQVEAVHGNALTAVVGAWCDEHAPAESLNKMGKRYRIDRSRANA